jgi:hypothetical protein
MVFNISVVAQSEFQKYDTYLKGAESFQKVCWPSTSQEIPRLYGHQGCNSLLTKARRWTSSSDS